MNVKVNCKVPLTSKGLRGDEAAQKGQVHIWKPQWYRQDRHWKGQQSCITAPGVRCWEVGLQVCSPAEETLSTNAHFFFNVGHCFYSLYGTYYNIASVLCFGLAFFFFGCRACGILLPSEGLNPHSLHWKTKS